MTVKGFLSWVGEERGSWRSAFGRWVLSIGSRWIVDVGALEAGFERAEENTMVAAARVVSGRVSSAS